MILEPLMKRTPRERWTLTAMALALVAVIGYLAAVAPSLNSLDGGRKDLETVRSGLDLQQRQLSWLRTQTESARKTLDELKDVPCPWISADKADGVLQEFQDDAASLGLEVHSMVREPASPARLRGVQMPVSQIVVRLELAGPYSSVLEMMRRMSKKGVAVGLEELCMEGADRPPYDVTVKLVVRLPVVEGANHV